MSHLLSQQSVLEPIHSLKPHPQNPREGDLGALIESVGRLGFFGGLVCQRSTRFILVGNHRWRAALEEGLTHLPVFWVDVDDEHALRILLADNRLNDLASYNNAALIDILQGLADTPLGLEATGYDGDALDELVADFNRPTVNLDRLYEPAGEEAAGELREKWCTAPKQLWVVPSLSMPGRKHRIFIGDSATDFPALLDGAEIDGVCTDPPYELDAGVVAGIVRNFAQVAIIMAADKLTMELGKHLVFRHMLIWRHRKGRLLPNPDLPYIMHALCPIFTTEPGLAVHFKKPDTKYGTLFECETEYEDGTFGHGKASEVFETMMAGFPHWKNVAEPFLGTGATLIACENTQRTCYAMELDPLRAAVALARIEAAGMSPELEADAIVIPAIAATKRQRKDAFFQKQK